MFTGIVQGTGTVNAVQARGGDVALDIAPGRLSLRDTKTGDSVAVSGVCLTITELGDTRFAVDVSRETLAYTTLGALEPRQPVNLELALRAGDPLGGHLVSGHVDGVGALVTRRQDGRSWRLQFEVPRDLARYVAPKGSICIDGVSLTVNEVDGARFDVNVIPHTLDVTTLGALEPGARVNIEVDLIARYLQRLVEFKS
jgi:riboflavin synthase